MTDGIPLIDGEDTPERILREMMVEGMGMGMVLQDVPLG